jgi:hypothetical protein
MEMIGTIFAGSAASGASIGGAIGGAAGTGAAAATAGAGLFSLLPGGSTAMTVLQGVSTAFSAMAAKGRGLAEAGAKRSDANQMDTRAEQEMLIGETEQKKAKKALLSQVSKTQVAYAASGIDLSQGTVVSAMDQATEEAEADLSTSRTLTLQRSANYRRRATQLRAEADLAEESGNLSAAGHWLNFGVGLLRRG